MNEFDEVEVVNPSIPMSREAEEAVIGSVFINPEAFYEVARFLAATDFYIVRNVWIWQAFEALTAKRISIDPLTIAEELDRAGQLGEIGGTAYLTGLINQVPTSLNAEHYGRIVAGYSERRTGIRLANQIAVAAYDETRDFSISEQALSVSGAARNNSKRIDTKEAASQMIDLVINETFYTTGIKDVDNKIGGLFPSELSILAGYQGSGKSAAKLQGARRNAEAGRRVLLCDLEMTAAQTWFRMACGDLGIDVNKVRSGQVSSEAKTRVMEYATELSDKYADRLVIYQSPMTPGDILTAAMLERPDIIYVDTLKNLAGKPTRDSERSWYDGALNFLRLNVAQQVGAHVQVLHHINRSTFKESRKPTLHDLMFAGESDADQVFILYRKPEEYEVNAAKPVVPVTWITDKSRFGWTGECEVSFHLTKQEIYGMDRHHG